MIINKLWSKKWIKKKLKKRVWNYFELSINTYSSIKMGPLASGACYDIVYGCESDYDKHKIWEHPVLNLSTRSFKVVMNWGNF